VCLRVAILVICVFIADINDVLDIIENFRVLAYADDLKLYMRVSSTDDSRLFQHDLDRLQSWCREKKYDLNAGKCKSISFSRGSKPVIFFNMSLAIVISSVFLMTLVCWSIVG
jgi:hypothetical protein